MRTSSEPAWASCATWMAVASTSAVSVFVIDCTTTGCAEPTGTPPTMTVAVGRLRGSSSAAHGRACPSRSARGVHGGGRDDGSGSHRPRRQPRVWIVEDEPAAAELAAELCEAMGRGGIGLPAAAPVPAALREAPPPMAVVLDWRLEHELSAALFMATRHRFPQLPVIYWTGSPASPAVDDPRRRRCTVLSTRPMAPRRSSGAGRGRARRSNRRDLPALGPARARSDGVHPAEAERGRDGARRRSRGAGSRRTSRSIVGVEHVEVARARQRPALRWRAP